MTRHKYILISLLYLLNMASVDLLSQTHVFKHYTVNEGLPSSEIYQVYQTNKGYIVLTSDRGVSMFDGYQFASHSLQEGVPDNTVFGMYDHDRNEELWFYTLSGRLFYYSQNAFHVLPKFDELNKELSSSKFISSLYIDDNEAIWLTISNTTNGFVIIQDRKNIEKGIMTDANSRIQPLYIGNNQYAIAMNDQGKEWRVRLKNGDIIDLNHIFNKGHMDGSIERMIENDSSIYLEFPSAVLQVNKYDRFYQFFYTDPLAVTHTYIDIENNLWIGLIQGGVLKYPNADLSGTPDQLLKDESVTSILQDCRQGFWFTTLNNGSYYMPWTDFYDYKDSQCNVITKYKGDLWVGYENGEVEQYLSNGTKKEHKLPSVEGYSAIQSIVGLNNRVYANCFNYIYEISENNNAEIFYRGHNRKLVAIDDQLWVLANGFSQIKRDEIEYSTQDIAFNKWTTSIFKESDSIFLVGTFEGLWQFDRKEIVPNNYGTQVLNGRISDVKLMKDVTVYATIGNGIVFKEQDSIYHLNKENDGLLSNVCNSIYIENDSVLWVSTNNGINKIVRANSQNSEVKYIISDITKGDALSSAEINQVVVQNNYVWAATNQGLQKFGKENFDFGKYTIPVYIKSLEINSKKVDCSKSIELSYDENDIKIDYVALFYKNPERILYRYKLQPDDKWIYTRNRSIQLTNLSENQYSFTLEASLDNKKWIQADRILRFVIYPPYWNTNWFLALIVLLSLILTIFFFYLRVYSLKKKTELQNQVLESEYKALKAQLNPHFMFNSLNSINSFILNNDRILASRYLTKFSKLMRLTLNNSTESYITLAKEIETLKLYLDMEVTRSEGKFEYMISSGSGLNPETCYIPAMLVQPFVENAVWHGVIPLEDRSGIIKIHFNMYSDKCIECIVDDNGVGRKKSVISNSADNTNSNSHATSIIDKRLNVISGLKKYDYRINVIDKIEGTEVHITIPIRND